MCEKNSLIEFREKVREKVGMAGKTYRRQQSSGPAPGVSSGKMYHHVLEILSKISPFMSVSPASRSHFIVSANQKANLKPARLYTHLNADWLFSTAVLLMAKFNKLLDFSGADPGIYKVGGLS